jgi:SET domain-containing protein
MDPSHLNTTFLEIKPSPIHGLGVFAKQTIPKGTKLGTYTGDKYSLKEFKEKYGKDISYCYVARRANYILCAKEKRNIMTYINESLTPNVFLYRFKLIANRDIEQGEELFLHYAKDYPRNYELN